MPVVDHMIRDLSADLPDWQRRVRIDHIYTSVTLEACRVLKVPALATLVSEPDSPIPIICSTEILQGSKAVFHKPRIRVRWRPPVPFQRKVVFDLSTGHIYSDTQREQFSRRTIMSVIAFLYEVADETLVFWPLIMGAPWLYKPPEGVSFNTMWLHYRFFEHYVEDIDEFRKAEAVPQDVNWSQMQRISEHAFKTCLAEILGDTVTKDWGGERSDLFTTHLHLKGRRHTAAFLLKGPGRRFAPMQARHLGKNGDQIYRLSQEPAELLIVQHCHEITSPVRAQLRAFTVQPYHARRYCLIDGRDSFRLLTAYNLVDKALALSAKRRV